MPIEGFSVDLPDTTTIIIEHLTYRAPTTTDHHSISGLCAALRDARGVTGRNVDSGVLERSENVATWIGALGYLITLEHLGKCFESIDAPHTGGHDIAYAARVFAGLGGAAPDILTALRHAFAHSYGLFNIPERRRPELTHRFKLLAENDDVVVAPPLMPWDGTDFDSASPLTETTVDLRALGNAVERAVSRARRQAHTSKLNTRIPPRELWLRHRLKVIPGWSPDVR